MTFERRLEALERRYAPAWQPDPERARLDREQAWLAKFLDADPEAASLYYDALLAACEYATRRGWDGSRLFEAVGLDATASELAHRFLERVMAYEQRTDRYLTEVRF